jgi:DMSO/TMAO reductase YedYZ heme-binding membrane subunit
LSHTPWHLRNIRKFIYVGLAFAIVAVAVSCFVGEPNRSVAWIGARELYGLWALALLVSSMLPGPINYVMPWFPLRAHLVLGRRAIGISGFVMACLHVICYLGPTIARNWINLFNGGKMWTAGLAMGAVMIVDMGILAFSSTNKAVRKMGPHIWKKWHRTVYLLLPLTLVHAIFLGADFGVNRGLDVKSEPDAGALIGMSILSACWLTLFLLRMKEIRIAPKLFQKRSKS